MKNTYKNNISITEQYFLTLFPGKHKLYKLLTTKPKNRQDFVQNYLPSKLWRLNNLYYIKDKRGATVVFKLNRAQWVVYAHLQVHPRLLVLKSRQQGISTLFLVSFFDDTIFLSTFECGLMAQDQPAATKLLDRVKFLWDRLDEDVKQYIGIQKRKQNASEVSFSNDSQLFIRTSFRSATLQRLHISELGKIANKTPEKAKETKTGTLQTLAPTNIGIIESTAEGDNMFKHMFDSGLAIKKAGLSAVESDVPMFQQLWSIEYLHKIKPVLAAKDFYPVFLSWLNDPDCVETVAQYVSPSTADYFTKVELETGITLTKQQKNFWVAQERELEGDIHQEYPATPSEAFSAAKDGTYWARKYLEFIVRKGQKKANLYDAHLPIYVVMDLGRNDYNVLLYFQFHEGYDGRQQIRIIHEYYNTGEGIDHYSSYLKQNLDYQTKVEWKPEDIEEIGLPHDALVIDLSSPGGKTRQELFEDEGITNTIVLDKSSKKAGVDAVRSAMPTIWIDESCTYIESCMLHYSREWNGLLNIWKDDNKRDEYAHGADTVRYMVQYCNDVLVTESQAGRNNTYNNAQAGL